MFSVLFDVQKGMQWEKFTVHLCWLSAVSENGEYLINCGMMRCSQHVQVLKPLYHIISHVLFPLCFFISQLSLLWLVISIVSPSFHITIISITSYISYNIIYIHIITHITTLPLVLLHHWAFIRKHQIHSNPVLPSVSKPCTPSVHIKIDGLAGCSVP